MSQIIKVVEKYDPIEQDNREPVVVFPQDLFAQLNLKSGCCLELTQFADGKIELKPHKQNNSIKQLKGLIKTDIALTTAQMNDAIEQAGGGANG